MTKLYPPPPRLDLVSRPRLVERLNGGLHAGHPLILISATAGFGKTTLASEWITASHLKNSVAWVSLDKDDNDPIRFLSYVIAAIQQVDPAIGENLIPALSASQSAPLTELVVQLINQIAASEKHVSLMLDDYHLITAEPVHQVVQLIIERQPQTMHTVLLTREDPPFPLPRMRARSQITEVRERDLRLTLPEAETFLTEAMDLDLSAEDVGKLKERTEGWVAGIQLAALALKDTVDADSRCAFIDAFTGSDRFIVDYLVSEVLERQPAAVRRFLLETSILERFCAELCDWVVNGEDSLSQSQPILDRLEQGNMFLVPLDNQRQWYRYHHLFAEMLHHTLLRSSPNRVPELHRRASEWMETRGFIQEAVKHALATRDWGYVRSLLDRHAMHVLTQGQCSTVIEWCSALPREMLEQMPDICIYFAWGLVLTFRNDYLDAVEDKLLLAERGIASPGIPDQAGVGPGGAVVPFRDWVVGQVCVVRSQLLLARFNAFVDPQELIALSIKGLELLPEGEKTIRSTCWINLAIAHLIRNDPVGADQAFNEALPYMLEGDNFLGVVTGVIYQARLAYILGNLDQAEKLCRQWQGKFAERSDHPARDIPATRGLDIILSMLLLERDHFDEAERLLVQALEVLGWASWEELLGFVTLARLRVQRSNLPGAEDVLRRMAKMGPQHAACAEALQHLFRCKMSPEDAQVRREAENWADTHAPDLAIPILALGIGPYHCDTAYICNLAWAQVQIGLGHPQKALIFLEPALASAREHGLTFRVIELMVSQSLAQEALGEHAAALLELQEALELAKPFGYSRVFDDGPALDQLLLEIRQSNTPSEYLDRLLASFHRTPTADTKQSSRNRLTIGAPASLGKGPAQGLVEPLSEREFDVLRLIAAGCSNAQIGARLYIAPGTVKRHITNVYGKLGVQTRTQAIVTAREKGLIP